MPYEVIGDCGIGQMPDQREQIMIELKLGTTYLQAVCPPPNGFRYEVRSMEHELGEYFQIVLAWNDPCRGVPEELVGQAEEALSRFDEP